MSMMGSAHWVLACCCVLSCARDPGHVKWSRAYLNAERNLEEGDTRKARAGFADLDATARYPRDKVLLRIRIAESHRREGNHAAAADILDELIKERGQPDSELEAKLIYLRSRVDLDWGKDKLGEERLGRLMVRFPHSTFGLRAFQILRSRYRARDKDKFVDWCRNQHAQLKDTPLADNLLYEASRVYFERKTAVSDGRAAAFLVRFRARWRFETSPLWDDATWDLSLIRHRQGRYRAEIALLRELLSTREPTWLWGSYDIGNYKHAAFRIGMVYYEQLKEYVQAAREFHSFPILFDKSRYRDDAIWWEGQSWLRSGDETKAAAAFAQLVSEHPRSPYVQRIKKGDFAP